MEDDAYAHIGIKRAKRKMVTKVILFGVATVLLTGQLISSLSLLVGPGMFPTMVGMLLMTNIIPIILLIVCVWRLVVWLKALNTPPSQDHGVVAEFNTTTDDDDDTTTTHILQLDNGKRVDLSDKLSSIFQGDDETRKRLITPGTRVVLIWYRDTPVYASIALEQPQQVQQATAQQAQTPLAPQTSLPPQTPVQPNAAPNPIHTARA
ncbi:hypothetical protein BTIS_0307 [Bifidobacterium tissieri]|uniref:Uncharacterized protein n=1 Tax=Bifidobacterium tissieri TaxID=1630162 RepID=A0A261FJ13_9BIFI|nr:hypothetical protein [Bifidobacterium tissieri]OZG59154.1 hypothetical protein BTIS_0307 [Bifidobacterium tissieri]